MSVLLSILGTRVPSFSVQRSFLAARPTGYSSSHSKSGVLQISTKQEPEMMQLEDSQICGVALERVYISLVGNNKKL